MTAAKKPKRGTAGAKRAAGSTPAPRSKTQMQSGATAARRAHNPKAGGSTPPSATNIEQPNAAKGSSRRRPVGQSGKAAAAAPEARKAPKRVIPPPEAVAMVEEAAKLMQAERAPHEKLEALGIDALCQRLRGGETLTAIATALEIGKTTLLDWLAADPDRSARAREARSAAAVMFDEQADQLLEGARDYFELAKAKERAQHLRWRASKVNPTAYGDKVQVDGTLNSKGLSDEQLVAELAKLGIVATVGPKPDAEAPGA